MLLIFFYKGSNFSDKNGELDILSQFSFFFHQNTIFLSISVVNFDSKRVEHLFILIFITESLMAFFVFLYSCTIFEKKKRKKERLTRFSHKSNEKSSIQESLWLAL